MEKEGKGLSKNLIWDWTLFKEGVRQTKWIALVWFIISGISFFSSSMVLTLNINTVLLCIMMYRLFKFSNKRNSSDFYNALGKSRTTIFISYLSVIMIWLFIGTLSIVSLDSIESVERYIGEQCVGREWTISHTNVYLREIADFISYSLLSIGAIAVALCSTGNGITHVLAAVVILYAPNYLCSYFMSGYYKLLPFIVEKNAIVLEGYLSDSAFVKLDKVLDSNNFFEFLSLPYYVGKILMVGIGVTLLVIGAVLFNKKKAEHAGVEALNGFWKFVLRSLLALVIAISADFAIAERVFYGNQAESDLSNIIITYVISILIWVLFDLFTGRNKKKNFKSLVWLPAFVILNVFVVVGIVSCGYKASEVPDISEVKSITIKQSSIDANDAKQSDAYEKIHKFAEFTDEKYMSNDKVKEILYNRWSNEMMRFKSPVINYSLDNDGREIFLISIETDSEVLERYISIDGYLMQEVAAAYVEASENIYDYEIPIKKIERETEYVRLGRLYAFTWDFNNTEICEVYNCYYEETKNNTFPLKTFLDVEYNKDGVFEYLTYYDESEYSRQIYLPIGVNSPETLETLAKVSNKKRTDFDFQWLLEYINGIGNEEKGATIDVFLYTDKDPKIRYESYFFWSNYTADLSKENLNKLSEITLAHKADTSFSAEENILVILYKDIEGVNTTCRWYNISDEEAEIVDDIIWDEGYFDCLNYSNLDYY